MKLQWLEMTAQSGYTGTAYLHALPDLDALVQTGEFTSSPKAEYVVHFTTPGTHTVWVRGYPANAAGDSVYIGLEEQVVDVTGFAPGAWEWANETTSGATATLRVEAGGLYTVTAWMREDGLRVDRLLLVTDTGYTPAGFGPAESGRQAAGGPGIPAMVDRVIDYGYDDLRSGPNGLYRLTSADYSTGEAYAYAYDPAGNRLEQTIGGVATGYQYDAANRLTSVNGQPYTWDANGNLLTTGVMTNAWDAANRLIETTRGGETLEPIYNGAGDRVAQTVGLTTTYFALDVQGLPEVIYISGGEAYLHLPGVIVAESAAGERRYLLSDGLGSVRQAADESGQVVAYHEFDPYGVPVQGGGEPYGYTGEWWDSYMELLHLRARWYAPAAGRFISKDIWTGFPERPLTLNGWNYVEGNPVNLIDARGHFPEHVCLFNWVDPCTRGRSELAPFDGYVEGLQINASSWLADNFEETFMAGMEDPLDFKKYAPFPYDPFFLSEYVGIEWTYDFVQKEWAVFAYKGSSYESPSLGSESFTIYNGVVNGFRGFSSPGAGLKAYEGLSVGGGGGIGISLIFEGGLGQAWSGNEQIQTKTFGVTFGAGLSGLDFDANPFGNAFATYYWTLRGPYPEGSAEQLGMVIQGGLDIPNNEFQVLFSGLPFRFTGHLPWLVILGPDGYKGRACALRVLDWYFDSE